MPRLHYWPLGLLLVSVCDTPAQAVQANLPWLSQEPSRPVQTPGAQALATELGRDAPALQPLAFNTLPAATLGLFEAVAIAVSRHPSIISAVSAIEQQQGQVDGARAGYYPKINAGMNSGRVNTYGYGQVATVSLSQMLHDFGKVEGSVTQAQGQVFKQQALLLKQVDSIAGQTAEAILEVHRQQSLLQIARDQVVAVEDVLQRVKLRADSGLTPQSDFIQATTRLQSAQANSQQVGTSLNQWRARLKTLVGSALPARVADLPPDLERLAQLDTPPDYGLLPDVLAAEADRRSAYGQLQNAKAQRYPTLALEATANQALSGTNPNNGIRHGSYNTLTLTGSMALYEGGAISAQVRGANAAIEHAESTINESRLTAEDALLRAHELAIGARARLGILAQRMASMSETRALYREQYSVGTRSVLDLLNAEQEVYQAAADQETARHDFWLGLITYIGAAGRSRQAYGLDTPPIEQGENQR